MIRLTATCLALALGLSAANARAATIALNDWLFSVDAGESIDTSAFSFTSGLGTVSMSVTGAGTHFAGVFVDHEIDEPINSAFNETGAANNAPAPAGLSWEIDEPGFGSLNFGTGGVLYMGDIFDNFPSTLDNQVFFDAFDNQSLLVPDDVSMAMLFDFTLAVDEIAEIDFVLGTVAPGGFHLAHTDPDSAETIYFSSRLAIRAISQVPEPGSAALLALGLAALGAARRRARNERRVGIPYIG